MLKMAERMPKRRQVELAELVENKLSLEAELNEKNVYYNFWLEKGKLCILKSNCELVLTQLLLF